MHSTPGPPVQHTCHTRPVIGRDIIHLVWPKKPPWVIFCLGFGVFITRAGEGGLWWVGIYRTSVMKGMVRSSFDFVQPLLNSVSEIADKKWRLQQQELSITA